ncbi:MAG: hypothetical protein FWG37_05125 [Clostridia bacterium]|nr:hypothetical protein [Clostridia bacterium]
MKRLCVSVLMGMMLVVLTVHVTPTVGKVYAVAQEYEIATYDEWEQEAHESSVDEGVTEENRHIDNADDADRIAVETAVVIEPIMDISVRTNGDVRNGTVTVFVVISGIPNGVHYGLQWQNNSGGSFRDVPYATDDSLTFDADRANLESDWRVVLTADSGTGNERFNSRSIRPADWVIIPVDEPLPNPVYSQEAKLLNVLEESDMEAPAVNGVTTDQEEELPYEGTDAEALEMSEETASEWDVTPDIALSVYTAGDMLAEGVEVTLFAEVRGIPEETAYSLQWQNLTNGSFQDVPNATGPYISFPADLASVRSVWRVMLTFDANGEQRVIPSQLICPAERPPRPVDELPALVDVKPSHVDEQPPLTVVETPHEQLSDAELEILRNEFADMFYRHDETDTEVADELNPEIKLNVIVDGTKLQLGTKVTIVADVLGVPDGAEYGLQWQNNLSGEFLDVPGATQASLSFPANENNVNCAWRVELRMAG